MPYYLFEFNQLLSLLSEFVQYFGSLLALLSIPVPVGIIGAWRWGIWMFRKGIGFFYRPERVTGYTDHNEPSHPCL